MTTACTNLLKKEFPSMDSETKQYIEGILTSSDDFESGDDLYDAIGALLHEIAAEKAEDDIRCDLCEQFLCIMKPSDNTRKGAHKVLDAPKSLGQMAANMEGIQEDISSIWVVSRDDNLKVNSKKLEKAQQKLQQKQDKRSDVVKPVATVPQLQTATASQVVSKKDNQSGAPFCILDVGGSRLPHPLQRLINKELFHQYLRQTFSEFDSESLAIDSSE